MDKNYVLPFLLLCISRSNVFFLAGRNIFPEIKDETFSHDVGSQKLKLNYEGLMAREDSNAWKQSDLNGAQMLRTGVGGNW